MKDYRTAMRTKLVQPLRPAVRKTLRTVKAPGSVEIVAGRRGEEPRLYIHGDRK